MLLLWVGLSRSTDFFAKPPGNPCPKGTDHYVDKSFEFDIPPNGWYYFYTSAFHRDYPLAYDIQSSSTINLYMHYNSYCPDGSLPANATIPPRQRTRIPIPIPDHVHVVTNGFRSVEGAHVWVKLLGQRQKKPMHPIFRGVILFVIMASITAVLFVKCILPPLKPKDE
jgi:hypothetical protein